MLLFLIFHSVRKWKKLHEAEGQAPGNSTKAKGAGQKEENNIIVVVVVIIIVIIITVGVARWNRPSPSLKVSTKAYEVRARWITTSATCVYRCKCYQTNRLIPVLLATHRVCRFVILLKMPGGRLVRILCLRELRIIQVTLSIGRWSFLTWIEAYSAYLAPVMAIRVSR